MKGPKPISLSVLLVLTLLPGFFGNLTDGGTIAATLGASTAGLATPTTTFGGGGVKINPLQRGGRAVKRRLEGARHTLIGRHVPLDVGR